MAKTGVENRAIRLGPVALTTTTTTNIWNPPTLTGGTPSDTSNSYLIINHIRVTNKTASAAKVGLWIGATGANAAGTESIFGGTASSGALTQGVSIPAQSYRDWFGELLMEPTDFLVGGSDIATALTISAEGEIGLAGAAASGPPITLGNANTTPNTNLSASQNTQQGAAWQAASSGALNFITISGPTTTNQTCNYRLCIYACTSQTVWSGVLLGSTLVQTGINANEIRKVALQATVNVTAGNWYAITVQPDVPGFTMGARSGGQGDRFFSDTYSDGALTTAGASGLNTTDTRCLLASTN